MCLYAKLDLDELTAYFIIKVPTAKVFVEIQNRGVFSISSTVGLELKLAMAQCSFVVMIFSIAGTYGFEAYGTCTGFQQIKSNPSTARVCIIRRGFVSFDEVVHVRDEQGLQGKPVSFARDGVRLGIAAGRALCRCIDKRAYRADMIHYRDASYVPRVVNASKSTSLGLVSRLETDILQMNYSDYSNFFHATNDVEQVPSMQHIPYRI